MVALKPSVGLVSSDGVLPVAKAQDAAGPITRTVADAAAGLSALAGKSYTVAPGGLTGKRVAVVGTPLASVTTALTTLGATAVTKTAGTVSTPSIINRAFEGTSTPTWRVPPAAPGRCRASSTTTPRTRSRA